MTRHPALSVLTLTPPHCDLSPTLPTGGIIMSASHNPGGPDEDFGIKFNYNSGEPAPERITDAIYDFTTSITELKMADIPDVDLTTVGVTKFGDFEVEVVDPVAVYKELLSKVPCRPAPWSMMIPSTACECVPQPWPGQHRR